MFSALSETAVWQLPLSEVRRQIVLDSRSTEGSVDEVGARPTDEKHTNVDQAQSLASVGDETAGVTRLGSREHPEYDLAQVTV